MSSTEKTDPLEAALDAATQAVKAGVVENDGVAVAPRQWTEFDNQSATQAPMGLPHLLDVPVKLTVEVGRSRLSLAELVRMGPGSLIELDREAHEPADILVNGKVVARGEIVTIGENYGVRITRVEK
jgi:flagellar motor switch protein FliN/FliY